MRNRSNGRQTGRHYANALITGASRGIGAAFARALPPSTNVMLVARDQAKLDEMAQELAGSDRRIETVSADLTSEAGIDAVIAAARAFGVDLLINNAGVGRWGAVLDNGVDEERAAVMVNVVAVLRLCRELLPTMIERAEAGGSRAGLINVSSTVAFAPVPFFATYAATKAFDLHFTEALAQELHGKAIDVVALCPGATRTDFGERKGVVSSAFPARVEPERVARDGLNALGRTTVVVSGCLEQKALYPLIAPRRAFAGTLGAALRRLAPRLIREQAAMSN